MKLQVPAILKRINAKAWIMAGLVMLLVVTGYLSYRLNGKDAKQAPADPQGAQQTAAEDGKSGDTVSVFYETYRQERRATREQEISYLDSIITGEMSSAETVAQAQEQKMNLAKAMEKEVVIEGLLKLKGFGDSVVTFSSGAVNVVVPDKSLEEAQVAQILDIVTTETGEKAENVKIIPSK